MIFWLIGKLIPHCLLTFEFIGLHSSTHKPERQTIMWIIEQQDTNGHWFIRGSERFEHDAAYHARRYKAQDDATPTRYRRADGSNQPIEIFAPDF